MTIGGSVGVDSCTIGENVAPKSAVSGVTLASVRNVGDPNKIPTACVVGCTNTCEPVVIVGALNVVPVAKPTGATVVPVVKVTGLNDVPAVNVSGTSVDPVRTEAPVNSTPTCNVVGLITIPELLVMPGA